MDPPGQRAQHARPSPARSYSMGGRGGELRTSRVLLDRMRQDGLLEETGPEADSARMDYLQQLAEPLQSRREAKAWLERRSKELVLQAGRGLDHVSWTSRAKFAARRAYRQTVGAALESDTLFALWASDIKAIEGHYGSGVGTYFRFLRFLFYLNSVICLLSLSFMLIPQLLDRFYIDGDSRNGTSYTNVTFHFEHLLTGTGWMAETELFYGQYSDGNVTALENASYGMPRAYFFTTLCCFVLALVVISVSMSRSYKKNFIDSEGGSHLEFCSRIFGSWDLAVTQKDACFLQKELIRNQLKDALDRHKSRDGDQRHCFVPSVFLVRLVANVFVLGVLGAIGYTTFYLLDVYPTQWEDGPSFEEQMAFSASTMAALAFVPLLYFQLSRLEDYSNARNQTYVNLLRMIALEVCILALVVWRYVIAADGGGDACWENAMGQEMYRLTVVFFLGIVLMTFLFETAHMLLYTRAGLSFVGPTEFDIARNSMHLIFAQTVVWLGHFFSPLLPLVFLMVLAVTFYMKKLSLYVNCSISRKPWRAAQSQTIFLMYTLLSLIGAGVAYAYAIAIQEPSKSCGPFMRNLHAYEIMATDDFFGTLFLFQPPFLCAVIAVLLVSIYYLRARGQARKKLVRLLRNRITSEGKNKLVLLRMMQIMNQPQGHAN